MTSAGTIAVRITQMQNPFVVSPQTTDIKLGMRLLISVIGVVLLAIGVFESFKLKDTAAFTALVVIGAMALLIAGMGRWPNKFSAAGVDTEWAAMQQKALNSMSDAFTLQMKNPSATAKDIEVLKQVHSDAVRSMLKIPEKP